jgi:hypothetical protein
MAYSLNIPIVKLYGGNLSVIDFVKTAKGYDVTVRLSYDDYTHARTLRRLSLRVDDDDRIFRARKIGDFDVARQQPGEISDVIIEFHGEKLKLKENIKAI